MGDTRGVRTTGTAITDLASADAWLLEVARAPAEAPPLPAQRRAGDPVHSGDCIGPYRITRELGRGGMGVVFEAIHTEIGQHVAVKVLASDLIADDEALHRFANEARAAAAVRHPNVVQVFDSGRLADGTPYILMEYVDGVLLRHLLRARDAVPALVALRIACQIASALSSLHAAGVVHRDLKLENVLLVSDDGTEGGYRAKILDFGIAHVADRNEWITREGRVIGTPVYMSPEQCAGERAIGPASDVYTLGVILFELVAGKPPFAGNAAAIMRMHLVDAPSFERLPIGVPQSLRDVLARMLKKQPAERPSTLEVTSELRRIQDGLESRGTAPTEPHRSVSRPRFATLGSGLLALLVAVLLCASAIGLALIGAHRPRPRVTIANMAWLAGGKFTFGESTAHVDAECSRLGPRCKRAALDCEQPAQEARVSPFHLDVHEVTNADYATWLNRSPPDTVVEEDKDRHELRFVRDAASGARLLDLAPPRSGITWSADSFKIVTAAELRPVVQVTWDGAAAYCRAHGKRLPTEAEWEFAARGHEGRRFPWGDAEPTCAGVCFGRDVKMPCEGLPDEPAPIETAPMDKTPEGVFDMGGNVMEWVGDASLVAYHASCGECVDPFIDWTGVPSEDFRVVRGGGWGNSVSVHAAARTRWRRTAVADDMGFRCALSDDRH